MRTHLHMLRHSLKRVKALVAWQQLKRREADPHRISVFQMPDATEAQLRNEYSLCVALAAGLRAMLANQSILISATSREDIGRQLAEIDHDINTLEPCHRPGGLGR